MLSKLNKKNSILFLISALIIAGLCYFIYYKDKTKYEPKMWIGLFDYRLNFRDVGDSLNKCLGSNAFNTQLVYRSNKYFSGWSCDKIDSPNKIYSLNFSPSYPHAYYCIKKDGEKLYGYHPNTTFELNDIDILKNWEKPDFKRTMCVFFKEALVDLSEKRSFLFHCDVGRDRTGVFAAMLTSLLAEQKNMLNENMLNAIECDYEKTSALEPFKKGRMKNFLMEMKKNGGVTRFIESQCEISPSVILNAADNYIPK